MRCRMCPNEISRVWRKSAADPNPAKAGSAPDRVANSPIAKDRRQPRQSRGRESSERARAFAGWQERWPQAMSGPPETAVDRGRDRARHVEANSAGRSPVAPPYRRFGPVPTTNRRQRFEPPQVEDVLHRSESIWKQWQFWSLCASSQTACWRSTSDGEKVHNLHFPGRPRQQRSSTQNSRQRHELI